MGKLTISVDPRMEVLSIIQAISNYPVIRREGDYYKKVYDHFNPYSDLPAVSMTDKLVSEHGFGYDAPVSFMLCLSGPKEFEKIANYSDGLITRAGTEENLNEYRDAIKEFTQKSNFAEFWDENKELYSKIIDCTIEDSHKVDWVKTLEDYYNQSQNSYNIVLNPLINGGYGPRIKAKNGKLDLYNICTTSKISPEGIPFLEQDQFAAFAWHEFSHSFVGPLMDKHIDRINKMSELFEPLRESMKKQAYGYWRICAEEHIVRAVVVRLYSLYLTEEMAKKQLQYDLDRNFIYIEPIIEKLKEYEELKKSKDMTFAEFFPEIISTLESF